MIKQQIKDSNECEEMQMQGKEKDCLGCSCNVCITQAPTELSANAYQELALRTANMVTEEGFILNGALGLCGESGEVADLIKKNLFQGHDLDKKKVIDELGDVCWYIAILAKGLNVDMEHVMKTNIEKLRKRYPDGFKAENSINRKGETDESN